MAINQQKITAHLWFDKEAGEAVQFYCSIFPNSRIIDSVVLHDTPSGDAESIRFELFGQSFMAISAGPYFKFNESISFVISCDTQEEIDTYWSKLSAHPEAEQCGWLKDKYGVSWQIVPSILDEILRKGNREEVDRITKAFLKMKKFDIKELLRAREG